MKAKLVFSFIFLLGLTYHYTTAQNTFYKQFSGKIQDKAVRVELIKAPSKENDFNLRGSYYYERIGKIIQLNNGVLDATGNFYLEEGFNKMDNFNSGATIFTKTGVFMGTYYEDRGLIEGTYTNLSSKQSFGFSLQENYSNSSIPADIIFNDLHYEEATIRFHYTKFKNHPSANKINQFIQQNVLGNMPEKMNLFLKAYKDALDLGGMVEGFENSSILYIIHNENNILTLHHKLSENTGGAHGVYKSLYYNFHLKTGDLIQLEEIFNKNFETELTQIAEQTLRSLYGVRPEQKLDEFGFTLPQGKFYLSKNFYLSREGIGFYYNVYEIAPYAVGSQDVFIPHTRIKHLLRKDSVMSRYWN